MNLEDFNYSHVGHPVTEGDLGDFENEIGGTIDMQFRRFLLQKNGGVPHPTFVSSISELKYEIAAVFGLVTGFSGLRRGFFDLDEQLEEEDYPIRGFLPIAVDIGDRLICIQVNRNLSPVFLVPEKCCGDEESISTQIVEVADGISRFAESLEQRETTLSHVEDLSAGSWQLVDEYLRSGGDIDAVAPSGLSLLCQAIRHDNMEVFEKLLARGVELESALYIAVVNRRFEMVKRLVARGCDPKEVVRFSVGPLGREIREFLTDRIEKDLREGRAADGAG